MLELDRLPEHLVVVGGSYVGLEFAQMYRRFGAEVTVIEKAPRLIAREDEEISETIREILMNEGVNARTSAECVSLAPHERGVEVGLNCQEGEPTSVGSHVLLAVGLLVGGGLALHLAPAQEPGIRRTELQRHDLGVPGREVVQVRVELDPGVAFGRHRHPGEEIVYVLEGALEYQVEGRPPTTLRAGDVLFIPAGTIHSAKNVGSDNGAELATYVVDKGKPLVELVK